MRTVKLVYVFDLEVDDSFSMETYLKQPSHRPATMWGDGVVQWVDTSAYIEETVLIEYEY